MTSILRFPFAALAVAISHTAFAADTVDGDLAPPVEGSAEEAHHDPAEEIIVTGVRRNANDVLGGVSVLDAADLSRELRPSIGETLASQPGVSASGIGPAASRPVLRGLSGDRIRILTDGIGSLDVSSSSADHAVAINPLTAERIEVLRGPSALLYGSSAIGGVVNVIDTRIPRRIPNSPVGLNALAAYGSAANERSASAAVDVPVGGGLVAHVDGSWSNSDNLETGGHLLSPELRREALASADPSVRALADLRGELPNSAAKSDEIAAGLAYVGGGMNVGASISRHSALYGVPIRFSLDPSVEAEAPTIDVVQTRGDVRAEFPLAGPFRELRFRGGIASYRHDEMEEDGAIGSTFRSDGGEGRMEIEQRERSGWGGTSGAQYLERTVSIAGDEKFLPDSRQRQIGLFTAQQLVSGPFRIEGGARIELSRLTADADDQLGTPSRHRRFTTVSASLGGAYDLAPGWRVGLTASQSARAPSIDELFANGPHAGTQAFEVGDPDLDPERSLSMEASIRRTAGPVKVIASAYYSRFSNFIYLARTGDTQEDLPVFATRQGAADYYGFEAQVDADLGRAAGFDWGAELIADGVRATIRDFGPAPQIPPLRLLGALTASAGQFDGRVEVEHSLAQNRTAPLERPTDAYTLVNLNFDWHPLADNPELTFGLSANNLFDAVARRHSSLLKDYAPIAGRDIRLTANIGF